MASTKPKIAVTLTYEAAFAELERIVTQMESAQMPLEAALQAYQRGSELLEHCQKSLAKVEQQVKVLSERQQLVPFEASAE